MKPFATVFALAAAGAAILLFLTLTGLTSYLRFEALQDSRLILKQWVTANGLWSVLFFVGLYFATTALSIPGAFILTLAAGYLFGPVWGTLLVNLGATLGAWVVFLVTQNFLGRKLQQKYQSQLQTFNTAFASEGTSYLLALRLIPAVPFFLVNILAGLTKVRGFTFVWTTSVGILAGSFVYAFAGSNLASISRPSEILSWPVLLSFLLLGLFSLVPAVVKRMRRHREV